MKIYFNKLLCIYLMLFCTLSCGTAKHTPSTSTETKVNYIDSLIVRDSIVVVPVERYVDIVPQYDTLHLETSIATADAWIDTTFKVLKGKIENKKGTVYREKRSDRINEKTDTVKIIKEVPVEVTKEKTVVPKWAWISLVFNIIVLLYVFFKIRRF